MVRALPAKFVIAFARLFSSTTSSADGLYLACLSLPDTGGLSEVRCPSIVVGRSALCPSIAGAFYRQAESKAEPIGKALDRYAENSSLVQSRTKRSGKQGESVC